MFLDRLFFIWGDISIWQEILNLGRGIILYCGIEVPNGEMKIDLKIHTIKINQIKLVAQDGAGIKKFQVKSRLNIWQNL